MQEEVSLQEKILAAILGLAEVKDPNRIIKEWSTMHADESLVDVLALGFPDDLLEQLHTACLSNTSSIKNQNRNTLRNVNDAVKRLPSVVVPVTKRRYIL